MRRFLLMGLAAIGLSLASEQTAQAWVNSQFSIGLNWKWQSSNNCWFFGLFCNGPGPCSPYGCNYCPYPYGCPCPIIPPAPPGVASVPDLAPYYYPSYFQHHAQSSDHGAPYAIGQPSYPSAPAQPATGNYPAYYGPGNYYQPVSYYGNYGPGYWYGR
jgi:hypothetical protein